jgi:hypothetical protein
MTAFILTAYDTSEDFEDTPSSLMPLAEWLAAQRAGAVAWSFDPYAAVGFWLTGNGELLEPSWGNPRALARDCRRLAAHLAATGVGALPSSGDFNTTYLVMAREGDVVRVVKTLERPAASDDGAVQAWAAAEAPRLLAASDNPRFDQRAGKRMRVPAAELLADLEREAAIADAVADLLGHGHLD